ncbi:hypothetical protein VTN00DRAFT_5116 [Thermoascus crustaceus]|uniref:uncharacterized protein n=1 Tax=Thermoascus crustaceus TaxID=5088 RepID=UPI003742E00D
MLSLLTILAGTVSFPFHTRGVLWFNILRPLLFISTFLRSPCTSWDQLDQSEGIDCLFRMLLEYIEGCLYSVGAAHDFHPKRFRN